MIVAHLPVLGLGAAAAAGAGAATLAYDETVLVSSAAFAPVTRANTLPSRTNRNSGTESTSYRSAKSDTSSAST